MTVKYRESLARLKKSKILIICQKKPLWETIFEENMFNFQESIVFEKMRKNVEIAVFTLLIMQKL